MAEKDIFEEAGIKLPSHLSTYSRRWASLLLVAISGAFASGPIASWPTLEPLLISEGVWAGPNQQTNLTFVFSIASGLSMVAIFGAGILYDAVGPRMVGAFGAFGVVISLIAMAIAIKIPSLNNLLWVAYPAASAFGFANSMDAWAWLWLLPDDQSTVSSVAGSIQIFSDSFCLLAVLLNHYYGLELPVYFGLTAVLSAIAGVIALVVIPSRDELLKISHGVISYRASLDAASQADDAEMDTSENILESTADESPVWDAFSKAGSSVKNTLILYTKVHPGIMSLYWGYSMLLFMFLVYPVFEMYPLYRGLVGTAKAVDLVDIFGGIYACIGAGSLLVFGRIVDKFGMAPSIAFVNIPVIICAYLYSVPSIPAQVAAQVLLSFMSNVWYVFAPRFVTAYGPPELFGTVFGLFAGALGLGQVILTKLGTYVSKSLVQTFSNMHVQVQHTTVYLLTIDSWCSLSVLASCSVLMYWWYYPMPAAGTTTMAHVRDAWSGGGRPAGEGLLADNQVKKPTLSQKILQKRASYGACCSCFQIPESKRSGADSNTPGMA